MDLQFDGVIEKEATKASADKHGDVELVTDLTVKDVRVGHLEFSRLLELMASGRVRITVEKIQHELDFGKLKEAES